MALDSVDCLPECLFKLLYRYQMEAGYDTGDHWGGNLLALGLKFEHLFYA